MMKKLLMATAVAMAFGSVSSVHAAGTILFDRDGAVGGDNSIQVNTFDWSPGNAIAIGVLGPTPSLVPTVNQVVAQGRLGSFVQPGGGSASPLGLSEFTFQISFYETSTNVGGPTAAFSTAPGMPSFFDIFYDPVADSDPITGDGFGLDVPGGGLRILHGTLVSLNGNFTDQTVLDSATYPDIGLLDRLNTDDQGGTRTHIGDGRTTVRIDIAPGDYNTDFFRTAISSLLIDLQDTSANGVPFEQTDPSNHVLDGLLSITPYYSVTAAGDRINGASSPGGCQNESGMAGANVTGLCDLHLQTDPSTSFNPIPEPGSLALLGIGMGAFGLIRRRKVAKA